MAKTEWSNHALDMAEAIAQEAKLVYGKVVYNKLIDRIELLQNRLASMPRMGSKEEALAEEDGEFRFLVINKRFKLVYEVINDEHVLIIAVWDFRQDPRTMRYFL